MTLIAIQQQKQPQIIRRLQAYTELQYQWIDFIFNEFSQFDSLRIRSMHRSLSLSFHILLSEPVRTPRYMTFRSPYIGCAKCWWQIFQIDNEFPLDEWVTIEISFAL